MWAQIFTSGTLPRRVRRVPLLLVYSVASVIIAVHQSFCILVAGKRPGPLTGELYTVGGCCHSNRPSLVGRQSYIIDLFGLWRVVCLYGLRDFVIGLKSDISLFLFKFILVWMQERRKMMRNKEEMWWSIETQHEGHLGTICIMIDWISRSFTNGVLLTYTNGILLSFTDEILLSFTNGFFSAIPMKSFGATPMVSSELY